MLTLPTRPRKPFRKRSSHWSRSVRYWYYRWLRVESTPAIFARGLAVGVFAGWFPFFGLQTIISVALATIVGGNKVIAALGTWVSNPVTYLPIYWFNFQLGRSLLGTQEQPFTLSSLQSWDTLSRLGQDFILALFLGSCVGGVVAGSAAYGIGLYGMRQWKQRRCQR
ncbi:MAG: DUF2062 domain-containing protein [Prochlorotrichaceae cyanobacterium]